MMAPPPGATPSPAGTPSKSPPSTRSPPKSTPRPPTACTPLTSTPSTMAPCPAATPSPAANERGAGPSLCLPKNWIRVKTPARMKKDDLEAPNYYYFNSITSITSWVPPILLPGKTIEKRQPSQPVNIIPTHNISDIRAHFHTTKPPSQSFQDAISGECDEERAVDQAPTEKEDERMEDTLEELTKLQ